jgi:hypothetical protein
MKVFINYENNENPDLHKTLKITLPKSWNNGPTSKVLTQFVESYNAIEALGGPNPLDESQLHLAIKDVNGDKNVFKDLASDAIIMDSIPDRSDIYVVHGPSQTLADMQSAAAAKHKRQQDERANTVQCQRFGCKHRFPRGGPYPSCHYHRAPPVFHETAKFWSCCPAKKAYDWDDFQNIPGCCTGTCTEVKESEGPQFLGGTDLREKVGEAKLKSIDDFNKTQAAGGAEAAPVLDRLQKALAEIGIEQELFQQVMDGIGKELRAKQGDVSDAELLELVKTELGQKLKNSMKAIAAEQLRIK